MEEDATNFVYAPINSFGSDTFTKSLEKECNPEVYSSKLLLSSLPVSSFFSAQSRYHYLWSLDLSDQRLTHLPSFVELPALGCLNLSKNCLSFQSIQRSLRCIEPLLHLVLEGNQLLQSMQPEQRKFLIYTLPNVWCLDYIYISDKQAQYAIDYFELHEGRHSDIFLYHFLPFQPAFIPSRIIQKRAAFSFDDWPTWPKFLFKHLPTSIDVPPVGSQLWHLGILSMDVQAEIYSQLSSSDTSYKQWILEFIDQEVSCLHFLFVILLLLDPRFPSPLVHACITDLWSHIAPPIPFLTISQFLALPKQCLLKLTTLLMGLLEIEEEKTHFIDGVFSKSLNKHVRYLVAYYSSGISFLPSRYISLELLLLTTVVHDPHIFLEFYPDLVQIYDPQEKRAGFKSTILKLHSHKLLGHIEELTVYSIELKYDFSLDIEQELQNLREKG